MTRVNLIPAHLLTDQHVRSELREIPRVITHAYKLWVSGKLNTALTPATYVLGTGHVRFFYNKLSFVLSRIRLLNHECKRRGFAGITADYYSHIKKMYSAIPRRFKRRFTPTVSEIAISIKRIILRVRIKIFWYRYYGNPLTNYSWGKLRASINSQSKTKYHAGR